MNLIDPKYTKAILIGVSECDDKNHFVNAPPIKNNLLKLEELLLDSAILGLPKENVIVFNQNERHDEILMSIKNALKKDTIDTIIFYFSGHGYRTKEGDFYLITKNTQVDFISSTAILWNDIKDIFQNKGYGIQQRLFILDTCHAGAATLSSHTLLDIEKGSALLAAATEREKAYFDKKKPYTYFTKALIETLENGHTNIALEAFNVDFIHNNIKTILKSSNTQIKTTDEINNVFFFKNKWYDQEINSRKKIKIDIQQAEELIVMENYPLAITILKNTLQHIKRLKNKHSLPSEVDKLLLICKDLPMYKPWVEKLFKVKFSKELEISQSRKRKIKNLKKQLAKLNTKNILLREQLKTLKSPSKTRNTESKENLKDFFENFDNISFDLTYVQGGIFKMGDIKCSDEQPVHNVDVPDFYIGKHLVTQKLWRAVMKKDPDKLHFKNCDECPVEGVSWDDIHEFLIELNKITDKDYRLPSEAEWEYAARGGIYNKNCEYAGSNDLDQVAWFASNAEGTTHTVGLKKANELGIYDMSGNLWEWLQDKWHNNYNGAPSDGSPWEEGDESNRVYRGGGWDYLAFDCRVALRSFDAPSDRDNNIGFRLACNISQIQQQSKTE